MICDQVDVGSLELCTKSINHEASISSIGCS